VSTSRYRFFYRRHLPHVQPLGATLFVTFRLVGSVRASVVQRLSQRAEHPRGALPTVQDPDQRRPRSCGDVNPLFGKWDAVLDETGAGPTWLARGEVAGLVARALHDGDGSRYDLLAFGLMPNHVHVVLTPLQGEDGSYYSLTSIMRFLKGRTARQANLILGRRGAFWQHENYDHVVRNEDELARIITSLLDNPVRAGLSHARGDWQWSYHKYEV
jgi:putative transposase